MARQFESYLDYKRAFIQKHSKDDWTVDTSSMDADGKYCKTYNFTDGAQLIEINRPVYETVEVEVEVKGIKVTIKDTVKLFETEAWNTDNAHSVKFYEKF